MNTARIKRANIGQNRSSRWLCDSMMIGGNIQFAAWYLFSDIATIARQTAMIAVEKISVFSPNDLRFDVSIALQSDFKSHLTPKVTRRRPRTFDFGIRPIRRSG